jgi:hypothetical protein
MGDEAKRENDGEKDPSESELEEIARRMIDEADIDLNFFELKVFLQDWIQKFPPQYFEHGTLVFQVENRQVANTFNTFREIEPSEIIKTLWPDL